MGCQCGKADQQSSLNMDQAYQPPSTIEPAIQVRPT